MYSSTVSTQCCGSQEEASSIPATGGGQRGLPGGGGPERDGAAHSTVSTRHGSPWVWPMAWTEDASSAAPVCWGI